MRDVHPKRNLHALRDYQTWTMAALGLAVALLIAVPTTQAATSFEGGGNDTWWFNYQNWSKGLGEDATTDPPNFLPPAQDDGAGNPSATDVQINDGLFLGGEGIVYDPDNDPYFNDAVYMAQFSYPTGSTATPYVGDYGPQNLYRLYISRNTTNTNLVTIKSGNLSVAEATIIGRSGSTVTEPNLGRVNQLGGTFQLPLQSLDMGHRETSGWGNGIWDYRGGTLNIANDGGVGIRLSSGGSAGVGGIGTFIMRNPGNQAGGYVRTWDFLVASHSGTNDGITDDRDPDGDIRGVGIVEFHYENGSVRPIQVQRNLTINNGESDTEGDEVRRRSSRLSLVLDEAPTVDGQGVPMDLGLFDVDFSGVGGVINGTGDIDGNATPNEDTDQVFSNIGNTGIYSEGAIVEAMFGLSTYRWNISYTGNITWSDPANSILDASVGEGGIEGPGTGVDVVLIGLDSEIIAGLLGDYNENDIIDAADYTVWRDNLGSPIPNDPTGGVAEAADYDYWKAHFGETAGSGSGALSTAAVPEPSSFLLLVMAMIGLSTWRRRG